MVKLGKGLLRESQRGSAEFMVDNPFSAVFSDMGFGKTITSLTVIERLFAEGKIKKALIVAPLRVARDTWTDEITSWEHTSRLSFKFLAGTPKKRKEAAKGRENVHIICQNNFVDLFMIAARTWPYDCVIFDDSEGFKNYSRISKPSTTICTESRDCMMFEPMEGSKGCGYHCEDFKAKRARPTRFGAVCALRNHMKYFYQLTGTPSSNQLVDLWPLIFTLDAGKRLGRTVTEYQKRYFTKSWDGFGWDLKPGSEEKIHTALRDICISIDSEAELPPCYSETWEVDLPPKAAAVYDELEREFIVDIEGEEVEAVNGGVLSNKLLQICEGSLYTHPPEVKPRPVAHLHDAKVQAIRDIRERHPGEPILIGINHAHGLKSLRAAFPEGIDIRDREDAVKAWNAGEIPMMFAHPGSAGHGLNLQRGPGRVLIWFGLNWRLDMNQQLNKRLHRPGQMQDVYIYYIVAKGRADVRVMEATRKKGVTQKALLDAVKRDARKNLQKT